MKVSIDDRAGCEAVQVRWQIDKPSILVAGARQSPRRPTRHPTSDLKLRSSSDQQSRQMVLPSLALMGCVNSARCSVASKAPSGQLASP